MAEDIKLHFKFLLYGMSLPIVTALVKHNIAEKLQESAKTAEELCLSSDMQPEKLFRYLRAVSALGLFSHNPSSNKWSNTEDSALLTTSISHSIWNFCGDTFTTEMLIHTLAQLSSPKPPMETLDRPEIFDQIGKDPNLFQTFQLCMTELSKSNSTEIIEGVQLEEGSKLLDVGGADGTLVISLANKYQNLTFGGF